MDWRLFTINLVPLSCVIASAAVAINGHDSWPWFLLVALLTHALPSKL
jgi:hypothetical protein